MRRRVVWSSSARADYLDALRYIAADNPYAAARVADRIDAAVAALGEFATGRPGRVTGTYEKVVSDLPYILAYEIVAAPDDSETIAILHVIHGARDWRAGQWPNKRDATGLRPIKGARHPFCRQDPIGCEDS